MRRRCYLLWEQADDAPPDAADAFVRRVEQTPAAVAAAEEAAAEADAAPLPDARLLDAARAARPLSSPPPACGAAPLLRSAAQYPAHFAHGRLRRPCCVGPSSASLLCLPAQLRAYAVRPLFVLGVLGF